MIHEVEISPELARLAQFRTRAIGSTLVNELARSIVQEAVYGSDPEQGLLVDEDLSYSKEDALVAAFGVNDIVVNEHRVDARSIDEEGRVAISRALIGTSYMENGTLVVDMTGHLTGKVVGFISAADWHAVDKNAGDQQVVYVKPKLNADFSMVKILAALSARQAAVPSAARVPEPFQLATFVANRAELPMSVQRQIVEGTLTNPNTWSQVEQSVKTWSNAAMKRIVSDSALWNSRIEKITDMLSSRFKKLNRDAIRKVVERLGETCGGQPESPYFRKTLLVTLTREELAHRLGGETLKKASAVAEAVLSGRAAADVIKDFAKNPVAIELAAQIKKQRNKLTDFVDATAQELSGAFQQMALQPAYSTHSQDPQDGVTAINETLSMMDAGDFAEQLKALEDELSNI